MDEQIQKLFEVVSKSEGEELTILNNAVVKNIKAYRADPSAANKKNWDAAQEGFQARVNELWEKYFYSGQSEQKLRNVLQVVEYLRRQNYKISKSAAYKHKKEGKLRPGPDGSFSARAVEKYAREWLEQAGGGGAGEEMQDA